MPFTTSGIELRGKLAAAEIAEAERFLRSGLSWMRLGVRWVYVAFFAGILVWFSVMNAIRGRSMNVSQNVVPLLFLLAVMAVLVLKQRLARARAGKRYNAGAPDRFRLTTTELSWESANGSRGSAPWPAYRGWREGKSVLFVLSQEKSRVVILPKTDLSAVDLEMVKGTLTAALGPAKTR